MLETLPDQGVDGPCRMRQSRRAGALTHLGYGKGLSGQEKMVEAGVEG